MCFTASAGNVRGLPQIYENNTYNYISTKSFDEQ